MNQTAHLIATLGYVGHLPGAPGTWGTLVALVPGALMLIYGGPVLLLAATVVVTFLGVWALARYERRTGRHDPPEGVIDECAGVWLALVPAGTTVLEIALVAAVFRVIDILKPWPCGALDRTRVPGWSGMVDDLVAGAYAALFALVLARITDVSWNA